jgi:hypothetical protein
MKYIKLHSTGNIAYFRNSDFLLGLQLSRLFNSLNTSRRAFLRIPSDNDPINKRDRVDCMLHHGAIIYECINTLRNSLHRLKTLKSWNSSDESVLFIKNQIENEDSFCRSILKTIRDKIVFHFDKTAIDSIAKDYPFSEGAIFIEASSETGIDYYFPIIDNIILSYISGIYRADSIYSDVPTEIIDKLTEVSVHLATTIMELTTDIVHPYMRRSRRKDPFACCTSRTPSAPGSRGFRTKGTCSRAPAARADRTC